MRVITGRFKGRRLRGPGGGDVRPTSDGLKGSLFNILGPSVQGAVFLDVFAGTGAIGLEALSRGAEQVVFVEIDPRCCRIIRQNLEHCRVTTGARIVQKEAFAALRSFARGGFRPDLVFLDPPYDFEPYGDLLHLLFGLGLAGDDTLVVIEHRAKKALAAEGPGFRLLRRIRQGEKCLSFFRRERSAVGEGNPTT